MAEWKTQFGYNSNQTYGYTYGLMYQPVPEQTSGKVSDWSESGLTDLSNYNPSVNQVYYEATARTQEETPPTSPEEDNFEDGCNYQNSGVVYYEETQGGNFVLTGPPRTAYENEPRRAGSDTPSDDSEATASPDSWSSVSSREGSLPHADPAMWVRNPLDDEADPATWMRKGINCAPNSRSPNATREVSSTLREDPQPFAFTANDSADTATSTPQAPLPSPRNQGTTTNPRGKVRVAFSESQMDVLFQRFSVQKYLTPAEMKQLAEVTGLTYKQVKTWFQNRRMKLRRHQKDKSWVSERYANKPGAVRGPIFPSMPPCMRPYSDPRAPLNQHMMEAYKPPPPNLGFYLAAVGNGPGPAAYPSWSTGRPQTPSPKAPTWPMPQVINPYDYAATFNPASANANPACQGTSFNKHEEQVNNCCSLGVEKEASQ